MRCEVNRCLSVIGFVVGFASILQPVPCRAQRTLTAVKDLTIDATKNDLSEVREVLASASGTIAVFQPQDMLIRFFSPAGVFLGAFGRNGEGPGEFRSMGWAGWNGDTLHIEDAGIRRVTFVGPDRKLLRTVSDPERILPPQAHRDDVPLLGGSAIVGVVADGTYLLDFFASGIIPAWLPHKSNVIGTSLVHVDRDGRLIQVTADLSNKESWCAWGTPAVTVPLCTHWTTSEGFTQGIAAVSTIHGAVGEGRYHLRVIGSLHGDTVINRDYDYQAVPIPSKTVDSIRARLTSQRGLSAQKKAVYESVPFPRSFPPVIRILVGMDASVWLEEHTPTPGEHLWRVLDAKGRMVGFTTVPSNVTLGDVRIATAWGTETDADGLQSIVRFRIH